MNYTELSSLLGQYLEAEEATYTANIGLFVRLAEEDIYRTVQLPVLIQNSTSFFGSDDPYMSTPTDYLSTYSMAVMVAGVHRYLQSKDVNYIREAYPDPSVSGVPRYFAQFDQENFLIAPTPDDNYPIELHYFYEPESISTSASGTNWLSENGENALLFGSLLHGYIYMKGDQDILVAYKGQYEKAIADLKTIAEGRVRKDSYRTSDQRLPV